MSLLAQGMKIPGSSDTLVAPSGLAPAVTGSSEGFVAAFSQTALDWVFYIAIFLTIVYIMWSGIQFITSGADPQRLQSARRRLMFAITGLIVVAMSFVIVKFVFTALGRNSNNAFQPYSGLVRPAPTS